MPIDASIPLGIKPPDPTQNLSSLLNVANTAQQLQGNSISLNERKALQPFLSDPSNYTDEQGNIDFNKAMPGIMRLAPTTGQKYLNDLAVAQKAHTDAQSAINSLTTENRAQVARVLYALPENATPDLVGKTIESLEQQYKGIKPATTLFMAGYRNALSKGPQAASDFIHQQAQGVLPQSTQQEMAAPAGVGFNTGQQSGVISTKPGTTVPQGQAFAVTQNQLSPSQMEAVQPDAQGNLHVVSRTTGGAITGTRPLQGATPAAPGPFTLPPNETKATMDELQGQRTAAQQAAVAAPVMHDINRTIVAEAGKGFNTGTLGALTQKITSATGYQFDPNDKATDYNILGKYLERSALTAAQSMGPHTNAGLEAAVRANGSLDYTPQALKKIAYLNDALVTGSQMYQQGLERAIQSSPNGVFAKRQFDQQWGQVATPQALRLKNAVDQGNKEEIQNIIKEVGGKGTKGATALYTQIKRLRELSGE